MFSHNKPKHITENSIKASSYIELPFKTKAVINIQNEDKKCFLWSIISCLHPTEDITHSYRLSTYQKYAALYTIDQYPVTIKMIPKIEKVNNLKINVFELIQLPNTKGDKIKDYTLEALYLSKNYYDDNVIDLLYYKKDDNEHYMWLKQIDLFFREGNNVQNNKIYLCKKCLSKFTTENALIKHKELCENHDFCKMIMPTEKDYKLKFTNHKFKNIVPFVIYGDFESLNKELTEIERVCICYKKQNLKSLDKNGELVDFKEPHKLFTIKKVHQTAAAYGIYIKSNYPELYESEYISFRGEDVVNEFCNKIIELEQIFSKLLSKK